MQLDKIVSAYESDNWSLLKDLLSNTEVNQMWPQVLAVLSKGKRPSQSVCDGFHTLWTERGHRIREQVSNDPLVIGALRVLLPVYCGEPLQLYRGENRIRWYNAEIGLAWTTKKSVAEMFARGLNAFHGGGVLLSTVAPVSAIIAGPGRHSIYLGEFEYIVDRQFLFEIDCCAVFPEVV